MPKKEDKLTSVLTRIDQILKRQNSLRFIFLQGLMRGMGTALGATILLALVTSVTLHFAGTPEVEAFLKSIVLSMFN